VQSNVISRKDENLLGLLPSGVEAGEQGMQAQPQKCWFVKILGKTSKNFGKHFDSYWQYSWNLASLSLSRLQVKVIS